MTFDERVQAVAKKGFTERQSRFLTTVVLHTGVCVPRQYARFCGIVYGAKTRKFFAKLVRLQYASMYDCRHNRARIYHVKEAQRRCLYRSAFLEENSPGTRQRILAARLDPGLSLFDSECELKYIVGDLARHAVLSIGCNL